MNSILTRITFYSTCVGMQILRACGQKRYQSALSLYPVAATLPLDRELKDVEDPYRADDHLVVAATLPLDRELKAGQGTVTFVSLVVAATLLVRRRLILPGVPNSELPFGVSGALRHVHLQQGSQECHDRNSQKQSSKS